MYTHNVDETRRNAAPKSVSRGGPGMREPDVVETCTSGEGANGSGDA